MGGVRAALPTELLLRLMNATPEQYAAVERILGCGQKDEGGMKNEEVFWDRTNGTDETDANAARGDSRPTVGEDVARSAFALLQKLELDAPLKAPSVLTVFRLYCVDGLSADRVAQKCRCAKGTVMSRLRFIESVTRTKPEQFRAMSGHLQQIDDDLRESGAREIYRQGLSGSATGEWDEDGR
jgi:hypothetical protein